MNAVRRVPVWVWCVAIAALLIVAGVVTLGALARQASEQAFLDAIDEDSTTDVGELPDEQLLVSLRLNCEKIADGWTLEDALDAAATNWQAVKHMGGTKAQYVANVRALFTASSESC